MISIIRLRLFPKRVVDEVPFFRKYTDKEKDNLGKFASKFFTLNTLYDANRRILKTSANEANAQQFVIDFWSAVASHMREWTEMDKGDLSKKELRENYISTQGVTIHALGRLGHYILINERDSMEQYLSGLKDIDWTRSNLDCWKERAITKSGRINRNEKGIFLTYIQIKRLLGVKIDTDEFAREKQQYE